MDRQVIGLLKPTLQNSIGITEVDYGYIVAAFQVAYAAGLVIAGRLVDRLGTRLGYSLFMGIWSLAGMAHAMARSALGFGTARFFLGLGEAATSRRQLRPSQIGFHRVSAHWLDCMVVQETIASLSSIAS